MPGFVAAFVLGMSSLFAIGLLVAAVAPSSTVANALIWPIFVAVMFLGGVYLPRWLLPEIVVQIGDFTPPGVQAMLDAWLGAPPQLLPLVIMARDHGRGRRGGSQAVPLGVSRLGHATESPSLRAIDAALGALGRRRSMEWCAYVFLARLDRVRRVATRSSGRRASRHARARRRRPSSGCT